MGNGSNLALGWKGRQQGIEASNIRINCSDGSFGGSLVGDDTGKIRSEIVEEILGHEVRQLGRLKHILMHHSASGDDLAQRVTRYAQRKPSCVLWADWSGVNVDDEGYGLKLRQHRDESIFL